MRGNKKPTWLWNCSWLIRLPARSFGLTFSYNGTGPWTQIFTNSASLAELSPTRPPWPSWSSSRNVLVRGVLDWPKFKYQLLSGAGLFSYKIWTKNSKTPIVNLLKNLRPFRNYISKIQWEIHILTFLNICQNSLKKKIRIEIWTF